MEVSIQKIQRQYRFGPSVLRPCRECTHSHYRKNSTDNGCDAVDCSFEPKQGWEKWLKNNKPFTFQESQELLDLVDHYFKKGYIEDHRTFHFRAAIANNTNPFRNEFTLKILADGVKAKQHQPDVICHKMVDKQMFMKIWEESNQQPAAHVWDEMLEQVIKEEFEKKAARVPYIAEKMMIKEIREATKFRTDWEFDELIEKADFLYAFTKFVLDKEKVWEDAQLRLIVKMIKILKEMYHIE